jgi:hypothetical protein
VNSLVNAPAVTVDGTVGRADGKGAGGEEGEERGSPRLVFRRPMLVSLRCMGQRNRVPGQTAVLPCSGPLLKYSCCRSTHCMGELNQCCDTASLAESSQLKKPQKNPSSEFIWDTKYELVL